MLPESKDFLFALLTTPSPTGHEHWIQEVVRSRMKDFTESMTTDLHGNLICAINTKAERRVMLAGHADQIGFMVRHITKEGFIYVGALGGIDPGVVPGSKVSIISSKGRVSGIFGRKPIHLQNSDERAKMTLDLKKFWIDIGARSKAEVERYIEIGDPVVFAPVVEELRNGCIAAPGIDNRVGLFVVMEALRLLAGEKLQVGVYAVSTVQEEVGLRGAMTAAYSVNPEVGIAVDVTFATDNPGGSQDDTKSVDIKLGGGPVITRGPNANIPLEQLLIDTAKKQKILYQISPDPRPLGNDANAMQTIRGGVAAGSVSIPNRYMHSQVEVCMLKDLENAARLLSKTILRINGKTSFIPQS
jgi:endoglucanase